jgi:hypothetical protein
MFDYALVALVEHAVAFQELFDVDFVVVGSPCDSVDFVVVV